MDGTAEKGREDELLVFGYACKLFRDDEKALFIDSGKHLIPWMADETLKIDRYDGRGALSDLRQHEPSTGGYDRWHGLTDRERKLEEVVDQERYMALYRDEDEERMLEEEEWKRLQSLAGDSGRYTQIGFSYGPGSAAGGGAESESAGVACPAVDDEPYRPPAALSVPADMPQPATRRHADIIERTALFVARQGPQMEILIKAKQSENAQFDFLSFDDPLQPFFRHMVVMIKAGRYTVGLQKPEEEEDESYLHPALNLSRPDIAPGRGADGMYQPSANCAYQRLVKNIRSSRRAADSPAGSGTCSPVPAAATAAAPAATTGPGEAPTATCSRPEEPAAGTPPTADARLIIDKMASYVAKNGRDFEGIVMGRGDERFSFLRSSHQHHAYYRRKLEQYERDLGKSKPAPVPTLATATAEHRTNKPVPVSFSIRPKPEKESAPLERSALPMEESEEEGEGEEGGAPSSAAGSSSEPNGDNRQQTAVVAAVSGPAAGSEPVKKPCRQAPIVAPAPGVGRDEIQMDRKRRAAQFLAKLRQDVDKIQQPVIGPQLPPGALPSAADWEGGAVTEPPPSERATPPQHHTEEEESGDEADLDKYKLVDSDSPHSVPELSGAASESGGSVAGTRSPGPSASPAHSDEPPLPSSDARDGSKPSSQRPASSRDEGSSSRRRVSSQDGNNSRRTSSRDHSDSRRRTDGRDESSRRRTSAREDREHRRRHRHKKRSSQRRRRQRRRDGSDSDEGRPPSRSTSLSRSPRRHKKRIKRPRSPPASYKRLTSSVATAVQESRRGRSARPEQSRSPARRKRKRSRSSRNHKHKSKKSKRPRRSRSHSVSRSRGGTPVAEVTIIPGPDPVPPGDVIDLTGVDSPERRLSQQPGSPAVAGGDAGDSGLAPAGRDPAAPAAAEDSRPGSTPRGASPTPVPSAAWSPAGSGSGQQSAQGSEARSGSESGSSRSGSPAGGSDIDWEREPEVPGPVLSRREEEARRTEEAIAQLKQKLVRRRPAGTANGAAAAPEPALPAHTASSTLVAQMAEGLKAKVHEMMKGSLLSK